MKEPLQMVFLVLPVFFLLACAGEQTEDAGKPNFVVIFCDDMGYADIEPYGHPTTATPNLTKIAAEGQKWTSFYVGAPVCTPSRAALLTGRLPIRSGMCSDNRRVLFPDSKGGLPQREITIAEVLKEGGYSSACIGKWHLGHLPEFLPTQQGFDYYYGIPYSNDMDRPEGVNHRQSILEPKISNFMVPLIRNTEEIERPADQTTITKRYTEEAVKFIEENQDRPFFVYLAHSMPHVPLFTSEEFTKVSRRGIYGDVIEEIDWSVGQVVNKLKELGLEKNTLVVFTSDNGPWLIFDEQGGTAGMLRGAKGGTFEGGVRVPGIFWWPGKIQPDIIRDPGATMDFLPTFANIAGVEAPDDRVLDGYDIGPVLFNSGENPRDEVIYYRGTQVFAIRKGKFKAHFLTQPEYGPNRVITEHDPPLLYDLGVDPGEQYNVAEDHPEVIQQMIEIKEQHEASVEPVENQLEKRMQDEEDYQKKSL
jgi:arylsulfatase A-like enzyme